MSLAIAQAKSAKMLTIITDNQKDDEWCRGTDWALQLPDVVKDYDIFYGKLANFSDNLATLDE